MSGSASIFDNYAMSTGLGQNDWLKQDWMKGFPALYNKGGEVPPIPATTGNGIYDTNFGKVMGGLQSAAGLFGAYNGYKQLGLAQDAFNFEKDMAQTNLANSANLTNEALAHRQRMRLSNRGIRGEDADTQIAAYTDKYGASGTLKGKY